MKPVETAHTNRRFMLPGGTEENDLPLCATEDEEGYSILVSTWLPTDEEREKIVQGYPIELVVWGMSHPPVSIAVGNDLV